MRPQDVAEILACVCGSVRPVNMPVVVSALIDLEILVEIDLDAAIAPGP